MSPSESQLRAALREGEGDLPDVNSAIASAMQVRFERRRRFNAVAGGAAAAAVVGIGVSLLVGLGSDSSENGGGSSADKAASAYSAAASSARAAGGQAAAPARSARASASSAVAPSAATRAEAIATDLTCPATPVRLMLPGGGGIGQFGSDGDLFSAPVAAARVCAYPLKASAHVRSTVLGGSAAATVAQHLEAAPAKQSHVVCASQNATVGGTIEVLGVTTQGAQLKPVVITIGCPTSRVTNGTAARFPAAVPTELRALLGTTSTKSTANGGPTPSR